MRPSGDDLGRRQLFSERVGPAFDRSGNQTSSQSCDSDGGNEARVDQCSRFTTFAEFGERLYSVNTRPNIAAMNVVTARTRNGPGASGDNAAATQMTAPLTTRRTARFDRDSLGAPRALRRLCTRTTPRARSGLPREATTRTRRCGIGEIWLVECGEARCIRDFR
jgi:hypothetical protein